MQLELSDHDGVFWQFCPMLVSSAHRRHDNGNVIREEFYQGQIADTLIRYHETHGGLLTRQDLAEFRVQVEPPVSTRFHGYEVYA